MTKAPISLQDLRRSLYVKAKAEPSWRFWGPSWKRLGPQAWGLHLPARGGKQAKSKAVVVVARTLAVLLHRLWTTQEPYMPFYEAAA
jgi:hypothetical protein